MCSKMPYRTKIDQLVKTVIDVRKTFEKRVGTGTNLCGYCIEASEEIGLFGPIVNISIRQELLYDNARKFCFRESSTVKLVSS